MTDVSRRGFLSLLVSLPLFAKLPKAAVAPPTLPRALPEGHVMRTILPFAPTLVRPGGIELLTVLPQRLFLPLRLITTSADPAARFEILHLAASGSPVLEEPVDAEFFSPIALGLRLRFDTVDPGQRVVLAIRNVGNSNARFAAALMGEVPERR